MSTVVKAKRLPKESPYWNVDKIRNLMNVYVRKVLTGILWRQNLTEKLLRFFFSKFSNGALNLTHDDTHDENCQQEHVCTFWALVKQNKRSFFSAKEKKTSFWNKLLSTSHVVMVNAFQASITEKSTPEVTKEFKLDELTKKDGKLN